MIGNIFANGRYTQVSGGTASTYINNYSGSQGVGNMRYNTTNQRMEVFDGNNWQQLNMGAASIGLSPEAESLLDWARDKRNKEMLYESMAKEHPSVKHALDSFKRAEEQLDLIYKLSKEHQNDFGEVQASP